jgi:Protein of unknown function DUF262
VRNEAKLEALAVRDLVRRRVGDAPDAWYLALVQRDEVWDQVRMRYLLDSLLAGYPIGTLLVCQVTQQAHAFQREEGGRAVMAVDPGAWQLLDGQQRINAMFSIFTGRSHYGRFFLHMYAPRPEATGPVTRRRARDQGLGYIHWIEDAEDDSRVPERALRIDLTRWYDWAEGDSRLRLTSAVASLGGPAPDVVAILNEIDPEFTGLLGGLDVGVARNRLSDLLSLWQEAAVPVEYRILRSPMDVLEVFTRLNRAGVQVAGPDLFFAAVKTVWPYAEQVVATTEATLTPHGEGKTWDPLVDRMTALRVLARLAARAVSRSDLVPLAIDRLTGERGDQLIGVMHQLSSPQSIPMRRMSALMSVLVENSSLGFGLYSVDPHLWDAVLAWAAVHPLGDDRAWLEANMIAIDSFLLASTAFRWVSVLGDRFARLAMTEALNAGVSGTEFPVERIPSVVRGANATLRGGRAQVHPLTSGEDKLRWADRNAPLLLAVLQRIDFRPHRDYFDWDHIYPRGRASLMWSPGPSGRWRRHHRYRRFVSSAGNLWGLDASTNRAVQDKLPAAKFMAIRELVKNERRPIWPTDDWSLLASEIDAFGQVGTMLEEGTDIDPAMELFHHTVVYRALRLVDAILQLLPLVAQYAGDADVLATDPSPDPPIAKALELDLAEQPTEPEPVIALVTKRD